MHFTGGNVKTLVFFYSVAEVGKVAFDIENAPAGFADKMVVVVAVMVVVDAAGKTAHVQNFARLRHAVKVSVNCRLAD